MDYYLELEVPSTATQDEIKSSFRKLAKKYHPDKNQDNKQAEERFKKIANAYEVLSDNEKRKKYDEGIAIKNNKNKNNKSNPESYYDFYSFNREYDINNLFTNIFSKIKLNITEEIKLNVSVKLEDLLNKNQKIITIDRKSICKTCSGDGGASNIKCTNCNGIGSIRERYSTIFGNSMRTITCPFCIGRGTTPEILCSNCNNGLVLEKHNIYFNIPEIDSDLFINGIEIKKEGHSNILKNRGSIKINFKEIKHERFKRDNLDLYTIQRESLKTLILGGTMIVKSLDSTFKIKVNPNSEGTEYRLKGKGLPGGDLYVTLEALIPNAKDLSLEELNFIENLYNKIQN